MDETDWWGRGAVDNEVMISKIIIYLNFGGTELFDFKAQIP